MTQFPKVPAVILLVLVFALLTVPESGMNTTVHACPPCGACLMGKVSPLCSGGVGGGGGSNCGADGYFYASGMDNDNYSEYYGVNATQTILAQSICGTTEWSSVGDFITVYFWTTCILPDGEPVFTPLSLGYLQGMTPTPTNIWASIPTYYWDNFLPTSAGMLSDCTYQFSNISSGISDYPQVGTQVSFQLESNVNNINGTGNYWFMWISGDNTLGEKVFVKISYVTAESNGGWEIGANMESHNTMNLASAQFFSLQSLTSKGETFYLFPWNSGYTQLQSSDGASPYQVTQCSATTYFMWSELAGRTQSPWSCEG